MNTTRFVIPFVAADVRRRTLRCSLESASLRRRLRGLLLATLLLLSSASAALNAAPLTNLTLTAALELAESTHPDLAEARAFAKAEVEVSQKRIALASAARVPDVNVEVLYRRIESARQDALDIGLGLPLPFSDQGRGRVQEARAQADAAEARSRATRIEMSSRLRAAHGQLTAALANLRGLETEILPRMQSLLKTADVRYAAGDTSLADVLPQRREFVAVRSQQLEALREAMQAWGSLKALQ